MPGSFHVLTPVQRTTTHTPTEARVLVYADTADYESYTKNTAPTTLTLSYVRHRSSSPTQHAAMCTKCRRTAYRPTTTSLMRFECDMLAG